LSSRRKIANIPNLVDDLDRRIAAALQVNGRATWRQVARAVGSSESTVARRAQQLIDGGFMRVTAVADPIRCGFGYPVLVQLTCEVGAADEAAELLAERPDVRFAALVTGAFDVVVELIVPSRRRLARILLEELPEIKGITQTTTESVLRNFKTAYDWSRDLLGPIAAELEPPPVPAGDPIAPDNIDLQLLQLLVEDGRRSFAQLAGGLGISESMARRRVDALVAAGCLKFATFVDPHHLGYDVEVLIWLRVDLARLEETALALSVRPEVRYLSATSGYSDLTCEVILRSQDDLYAFSTEALAALPGVREVDFALELATLKRGFFRAGDYVSKEER
jgi:DNA-binding Lrp family transcriptional regulator